MRRFLIKILLRLIDLSSKPDKEVASQWLERQGGTQGYLQYTRQRKMDLKTELTKRSMSKEDRQQVIGQIIELEAFQAFVESASQGS